MTDEEAALVCDRLKAGTHYDDPESEAALTSAAAALRVKGQLVEALEAQERRVEMDRRGVEPFDPEYIKAWEDADSKRRAALKAAKETPTNG